MARERAACRAQPAPQKRKFKRQDAVKVNDIELYEAARQYSDAMEEGKLSEDTIVANIMGAQSEDLLTGAQAEYKEQIKAAIKKKAKEMEEAHQAGSDEFKRGCDLYAKGRYADAEQQLLAAQKQAARFTKLGGEIDINLALTQNALGKQEQSIDTFKSLEKNHPLRKTRQQAEHLRYILEAPKLELNEDEYIQIPSLSHVSTPYRGSRRRSRAPSGGPASNAEKPDKTLEDKYSAEWQPPAYVRNKYFWWAAAFTMLLGLYMSIFQRQLF